MSNTHEGSEFDQDKNSLPPSNSEMAEYHTEDSVLIADREWFEEHNNAIRFQQHTRKAVSIAATMRGMLFIAFTSVSGQLLRPYVEQLPPGLPMWVKIPLGTAIIGVMVYVWVFFGLRAARMSTMADWSMKMRDIFASPGMRDYDLRFNPPQKKAENIPEVTHAKGNGRGRRARPYGAPIAAFLARTEREGLEKSAAQKDAALADWLLEEFRAQGISEPDPRNAAADARGALNTWIASRRVDQ